MGKTVIAASGLDGLVGTKIASLLKDDFDFVDLNVKIMDITDKEQVKDVINSYDFDIFLHLAAFTNVDASEENKPLAKKINVDGTQNIFDAVVTGKNKKMIYFSTGFVFDGKNPPFYENSKPNPISYYGQTKFEGEQIIKDKGMTIRIDYPYGGHVSYKKDILESIVNTLKEGKPLNGIVDQIFTPTHIDDIAYALKHLVNNFSPEIYHIVGADSISGYDIITTICDVFGISSEKVGKTTYDEFYKGKAPRPRNNTMKSVKNNFYTMKTFRQGLEFIKKS